MSRIVGAKFQLKFALVRASMVVTNSLKLFRTGTDRHSGVLMSLLLLVAETIMPECNCSTRNISGQGRGIVELEHLDKYFFKNTRKRTPTGKHFVTNNGSD